MITIIILILFVRLKINFPFATIAFFIYISLAESLPGDIVAWIPRESTAIYYSVLYGYPSGTGKLPDQRRSADPRIQQRRPAKVKARWMAKSQSLPGIHGVGGRQEHRQPLNFV
jgi:hypothetical protein